MNRFRPHVGGIAVALAVAIATPTQGQRIADPSLVAAQDSVPIGTPLNIQPGPARTLQLPPRKDLIQPILRDDAFLHDSGDSQRWSAGRRVTAGALTGAVVGVAALYLTNWSNCTETGSMCGLIGIPLYGGAGAVVGGLVGYMLGSRPN